VRGTTKLLMRLFWVGLGQISIQFAVYGIKMRFFLITDDWKNYAFDIFFLSIAVISFLLNYRFISRSNRLPGSMRRTKAAVFSMAATLSSLFCGMLLCVNTFGE
jgi:hypothetical protein